MNPPYELKGVFADAQNMSTRSPVRIAGVEVGQVTKVEALLRGLRPDRRDDGAEGRRAADPRGRRAQDPAAHLPRGQLLRRARPGHALGARAGRRRDDPGGADRAGRSSSTRSSPRSRATRARTSRSCSRATATALNGEPLPGEDADQEPMTQGETAAESLNDSLDTAADALRGHRDRQRRHARHRAARPVEARHRPEPGLRGARREGGAAQGLRHELQPDDGGVRRRGGQPAADDPPAARGARAGRPGARRR